MTASLSAVGADQAMHLAGRRVLVAEDDPGLNHMLELALSEIGMQVESAFSYTTASAAIRTKVLDFCLFDYQLPDGNGLQLLQLLRSMHPGLPVLMMSANPDESVVRAAATLRAEGFLEKPVRIDEVEAIIATALRRKSR